MRYEPGSAVTNGQVYLTTLPVVEPAGITVQRIVAFVGSVIVQVTAPVGATATPKPVTIVVKVVVPPRLALEALTVMPGVCLKMVSVIVELGAAT